MSAVETHYHRGYEIVVRKRFDRWEVQFFRGQRDLPSLQNVCAFNRSRAAALANAELVIEQILKPGRFVGVSRSAIAKNRTFD